MRGSYLEDERLESQPAQTKGFGMTLGGPEQSAFEQQEGRKTAGYEPPTKFGKAKVLLSIVIFIERST